MIDVGCFSALGHYCGAAALLTEAKLFFLPVYFFYDWRTRLWSLLIVLLLIFCLLIMFRLWDFSQYFASVCLISVNIIYSASQVYFHWCLVAYFLWCLRWCNKSSKWLFQWVVGRTSWCCLNWTNADSEIISSLAKVSPPSFFPQIKNISTLTLVSYTCHKFWHWYFMMLFTFRPNYQF